MALQQETVWWMIRGVSTAPYYKRKWFLQPFVFIEPESDQRQLQREKGGGFKSS